MESEKEFTREEIEGRNTTQCTQIIIDNIVYDVTEFLEEHPGGIEVLLDNGGKDASRCFHDVGHSELAIEWRSKFRIGQVVASQRREVEKRKPHSAVQSEPLTLSAVLNVWGPPMVLAAFSTLLYIYLF